MQPREMNEGMRGDLVGKIKISEAQESAGHGEKVTPSAFGGSKLYDYYLCFLFTAVVTFLSLLPSLAVAQHSLSNMMTLP